MILARLSSPTINTMLLELIQLAMQISKLFFPVKYKMDKKSTQIIKCDKHQQNTQSLVYLIDKGLLFRSTVPIHKHLWILHKNVALGYYFILDYKPDTTITISALAIPFLFLFLSYPRACTHSRTGKPPNNCLCRFKGIFVSFGTRDSCGLWDDQKRVTKGIINMTHQPRQRI